MAYFYASVTGSREFYDTRVAYRCNLSTGSTWNYRGYIVSTYSRMEDIFSGYGTWCVARQTDDRVSYSQRRMHSQYSFVSTDMVEGFGMCMCWTMVSIMVLLDAECHGATRSPPKGLYFDPPTLP